MITKFLSLYLSYSSCSLAYCGVSPHLEATFTTSTFFPFKEESGNSLPSIVVTLKSYKDLFCASREIAHTIVITIKMNDFILNIYLVCYIINEVMQRNVLPQHKIACFFVSMPNGLTTIQLYAKLSVHINQASVSYGASVGFLGGNASSL